MKNSNKIASNIPPIIFAVASGSVERIQITNKATTIIIAIATKADTRIDPKNPHMSLSGLD
jgi:hypothetical protein